ncbi:hypothetical protein FRB95_010159 [Tulasnella sp. JGI-2019a]|nr:hypothetical protein FRB95_010159 [Tulasnella sp. JGI-2019a]
MWLILEMLHLPATEDVNMNSTTMGAMTEGTDALKVTHGGLSINKVPMGGDLVPQHSSARKTVVVMCIYLRAGYIQVGIRDSFGTFFGSAQEGKRRG